MPRPVYRLASDDHQPEVGLEQVVLGPAAVLGDPLQVDALVRGHPLGLGELLLGEQAGLDPLGELDLLLGVEQRYLADLLEVVLDRVGGRAGDGHLGGRAGRRRRRRRRRSRRRRLRLAPCPRRGRRGARGRGAGAGRGVVRVVGVLVAVRVVAAGRPPTRSASASGESAISRSSASSVSPRSSRSSKVCQVDRLVEVGVLVKLVGRRRGRPRPPGRQADPGTAPPRAPRAPWPRERSHRRCSCAVSSDRPPPADAVGWLLGHPRIPGRGAGRPGALARRGVGSAHHHGHLFLRWVAWLSCVRTLIGPSREGLDAWTVPGSRLPACLGDVRQQPARLLSTTIGGPWECLVHVGRAGQPRRGHRWSRRRPGDPAAVGRPLAGTCMTSTVTSSSCSWPASMLSSRYCSSRPGAPSRSCGAAAAILTSSSRPGVEAAHPVLHEPVGVEDRGASPAAAGRRAACAGWPSRAACPPPRCRAPAARPG